jgi:integrase/recombinase XerD
MNTFAFSIKFYLENRRAIPDGRSPIYVRVIKGRHKAEANLKEFIYPDKWDSTKGRVVLKSPEALRINHKLASIEKDISDIRWDFERSKKQYSARDIMDIIKGTGITEEPTLLAFFDEHIQEIIDRKLHTRSVINHYKQARAKLADFLKTIRKERILLSQFTRAMVFSFETYILSTKVRVIDRPLNRNTTNRYLVKVRALFNKAILKEYILRSPFMGFAIHEAPSTTVYLTEAELKRIEQHPLSGNPCLIRVRDIFLFSAYSGLRFGDAIGLREDNISRDSDGTLWITLRQDKTGQPIQIPMLFPAEQIYQRYTGERERTGFVLPRLSNQKVNTFLKEIARLVGIDKKVTHHVARHTFATSVLLDNGIPLETVSRFLGHMELKTTQIYAKITKGNLGSMARKLNISIQSSRQEIKKDFSEISAKLSKEAVYFKN